MSTETRPVEFVSRSYCELHEDPIKNAGEITAVWMIRDPDTHPGEPLRVALDQATVDHMGWRSGDAVTLVPVPPEAGCSKGKIIIRRARPGELALLLGEPPVLPEPDFESSLSLELHGPKFEWRFPVPWVEAYFPGDYNPDVYDFNSRTERWWPLTDIHGQTDQIELLLGPEKLFLYLQRTSPTPTTLGLHLPPGLLHLMGWARSTPLVLESSTDFDPFSTEDVLTIRENCLGEEPNLYARSERYAVDVNALWLNRFFPDVYDPTDSPELGKSEDQYPPGQEGDDQSVYRDTFVVAYPDMISRGHALSFEIIPPRPSR